MSGAAAIIEISARIQYRGNRAGGMSRLKNGSPPPADILRGIQEDLAGLGIPPPSSLRGTWQSATVSCSWYVMKNSDLHETIVRVASNKLSREDERVKDISKISLDRSFIAKRPVPPTWLGGQGKAVRTATTIRQARNSASELRPTPPSNRSHTTTEWPTPSVDTVEPYTHDEIYPGFKLTGSNSIKISQKLDCAQQFLRPVSGENTNQTSVDVRSVNDISINSSRLPSEPTSSVKQSAMRQPTTSVHVTPNITTEATGIVTQDANSATRELADVRRQLAVLKAREGTLIAKLGLLDGHNDPQINYAADKADLLSKAVQTEPEDGRQCSMRCDVEAAFKREHELRVQAQSALADIKRECISPFVVPALMDAFANLAALSEQAVVASLHQV